MSGGEDGSEKSFDATPKKLEDARKKGEIARSTDVTVALSYFGVWLFLIMFGGSQIMQVGTALQGLVSAAFERPDELLFGSGAGFLYPFAVHPGRFLLSLAVMPASLIVLALLAQRAFLFTPSKLKFKASRLSLIQNAKNKFGRSGLFEFAKSFVKLIVYSISLSIFLMQNLDTIIGTIVSHDRAALIVLFELMGSFLALVVLIAVVIGLIDFTWQHHEHLRKNMMTQKEIRDEMKDAEGDPHMKQARRGRAQEIAMNQMMADVPLADVVIVNPTHFAVALQWAGDKSSAPICVAKGVDEIALRIRAIAEEAAVPIHSDPPTARALHRVVEIGQEIKQEHYAAVALAIRFADTLRRTKRTYR